MVDHQATVCCMCGDIGFPEKLFRCTGCKHRFQHSYDFPTYMCHASSFVGLFCRYCSNYYGGLCEDGTALCDWCQSKERSANPNPRREIPTTGMTSKRSEYSGDKIKRSSDGVREESSSDRAGKNDGSAPSPRRRYKFLKDVMC
ncbi:hypothetical protein ACLOJK_033317 [Asimina triloba]